MATGEGDREATAIFQGVAGSLGEKPGCAVTEGFPVRIDVDHA
jgi:hypothetical protein